MKKPSEMTPQELRALPEYRPFTTICITSTDMLAQYPDYRLGDTIHIRKEPEFLLNEIGKNAIAFWTDDLGTWTPVKTSAGWHKQRFPY